MGRVADNGLIEWCRQQRARFRSSRRWRIIDAVVEWIVAIVFLVIVAMLTLYW